MKDERSFLRLSVESGGCHGFQYYFKLDKCQESDDIMFSRGRARLVVDEISLPFLNGSKVDYADELIGSYFCVTDNPMAGTGCGCGASFAYKGLSNKN